MIKSGILHEDSLSPLLLHLILIDLTDYSKHKKERRFRNAK